MSQYSKISRRDFIKMAGLVAASGTLAACGVKATEAPATEAATATVKHVDTFYCMGVGLVYQTGTL